MRTTLMTFLMVLTFVFGACFQAGASAFSEKVNSIVDKAQQNRISTGEAETNCLKLLETASTPDEQGEVYLALVGICGNHIEELWQKTAEYCEQALRFPQSVQDTCHIDLFWSGALYTAYWKQLSDPAQAPRVRRLIIKPSLAGLAIIATNQIPEQRPRQTVVDLITVFGSEDARAQELIKKNEEQAKARAKEDYECAMIDKREFLMASITELYNDHQTNLDEVKDEASRIFPNSKDVDALMEKVKARISPKSVR